MNRRTRFPIPFLAALFLLPAAGAFAHVPYLEYVDYSWERPMQVPEPVAKSRAFYSWFHDGDDVDVYAFEIEPPARVYAQSLVPVCQGYEDLLPAFAIAGPGLPAPEVELPVELPEGYGAWVVESPEPWTPRETFYEPFGDKWYFEGPLFDREVDTAGTWYFIYWSPTGKAGDYVAVAGPSEIWEIPDILRALVFTPMIRLGEELHIECRVCPYVDGRVLHDQDVDGVGDMCDNCPEAPNPDQADADADRYGEACDCRDGDPQVNPGMPEFPDDGIDSNCAPQMCSGGPVAPGSPCDNCFIATAAFGTAMAGKIDVLRAFRDRHLLTQDPGRRLVDLYYRTSPPLAQWIAGRPWLRALVRTLLLPVVGLASLLV